MQLNIVESPCAKSTGKTALGSRLAREANSFFALALFMSIAACAGGAGGGGGDSILGEDAGSISVSPLTDLVSRGTEGGSFSPGAQAYVLTNVGSLTAAWTAVSNQSWVSLSNTVGALNPSEQTSVIVAISQGQAGMLPVGLHSAQVTFTELLSGASVTRDVTLTVESASAGSSDIAVESAFGFGSIGEVGGPFVPGMKTYIVTNPGSAALNWTASANVPWVALDSAAGTLSAGANTGVTVSIDQVAAGALPAGIYSGALTFTDTDTSKTAVRQLKLTITAGTPDVSVMLVDPSTTQTVSGVVGGSFAPTSTAYTISNVGSENLDWTLSANVPWLILGVASGTVLPAGSQALNVSVNQGLAAALAVGSYTGVLTFTDTGTGDLETRDVVLNVTATPVSELTLTPNIAFSASGEAGGNFSPAFIVYTLGNAGSAALDWTASSDASWVGFSASSGQLAAGASLDITVSIDQTQAAALAQGSYDGILSFTDTGLATSETRDVILTVTPPVASGTDLTLTPAGSFGSMGLQGGPFAPASMAYTLANTGSSPITWTASDDQPWITLSTSGGTLAPSTTTVVTVSIDQASAATLPVGTFSGTLTITDTAAGFDLTSGITLTVNPASGSGSMASSVSQFGITWTFDRPYLVGQFANDDWWVVGPLNIVGISPNSVNSSGRTMHGSEINPLPSRGMQQGFDSSMYAQYASPGDYSSALNVGLNISVGTPLVVPVSSSLVSTVSVTEAQARPQISTCAILTVLDAVPAAGSFRPAYTGGDKTILFNETDLDYAKLGSLAPVSGMSLTLNQVEDFFERPWLDHVAKFPGRYLHPKQNMQDYGRDLTSEISIGAIYLHMNFSNAQKRTLLVRFVQLGIDLHGITQTGGKGNWQAAEGHSGGRKWPILFAGLMLNDGVMSSVGFDDTIQFGEDQQTFFVAETSSGVYNFGYGEYDAGDVGLPEWGGFHEVKPSSDAKGWFANPYRLCCTANVWWGLTLSAHIMGARSAWNHEPLFDYMDRFRSENKARGITDFRNAWRNFDFDMYEAYRDDY